MPTNHHHHTLLTLADGAYVCKPCEETVIVFTEEEARNLSDENFDLREAVANLRDTLARTRVWNAEKRNTIDALYREIDSLRLQVDTWQDDYRELRKENRKLGADRDYWQNLAQEFAGRLGDIRDILE